MGRIDSADVFQDHKALWPSGYVLSIEPGGKWALSTSAYKAATRRLAFGRCDWPRANGTTPSLLSKETRYRFLSTERRSPPNRRLAPSGYVCSRYRLEPGAIRQSFGRPSIALAGVLIFVGAGDLVEKQTQVAAQNNVRSELGRGRRLYTLDEISNECLQRDLALREWSLVDRG